MRKRHLGVTLLLAALALVFTQAVLAASPSHAALGRQAAPAANPWDAYNYSPTSHTLAPVAVYKTNGTVSNPNNVLSGQATRISGNGAYITLDFGKEVGGIISLTFAGASDANQSVGLAFSESSNNVGTASDASNGGGGADGAVIATVTGAGSYTVPTAQLRGGFRYLTVFLNSSGWVDLSRVSLNFTAAPTMSNPSQYANYFYSSDDLLNKLWYSGAYTVQLDSIAPNQGRVWPPVSSGWNNSATLGPGTTIMVDGAKRDRLVWPGDMGIAVPTAYVSTGDLLSTKNSLTSLYNVQNATTGELPYVGPPANTGLSGSDTYHMWALVGTYNYYLYAGDKAWLDGIWSQYKHGVTYIANKIDGNGLLNVTNTADWARGDQGGENIEANAILYHVLATGALLAQTEGDSATATNYANQAASLKAKINATLWDASAGAYKDNPNNSGLHPQDGNALAIWFNVIDASTKAQSILTALRGNWNSFGSHTPEWGNISPFTGSMELYARFAANDDTNAIAMMKLEWGYMLNASIGTNSTFWEGVTDSGALGYGPSYTSLAHGWSSGPTGALTTDVLGVAPDTTTGQTYHVIPHPGDLTHAEGKLTVAASKALNVSYDHGAAGDFTLHVDASSNGGSVGVIAMPKFGQNHVVQINGTTAWNGSTFVGVSGVASADQDANYIYFRGVQPGAYTLSYPAITNNVYEAEANGNTLAGSAGVVSCAGCSGGARVGWVGNGDGRNGTLRFNNVNVGSAGTYQMTIAYTNGATTARSATLSVNGGAPTTITSFTPTTNANTTNTVTVNVTLNAGGNTITFANSTTWAPDFDKITLASSAIPPAVPGGWTQCASENQTCSFAGTATVAYGANGQFAYGSFTNGTTCSNGVFGDPAFGVAKTCFVSTGFVPPTPGVWTACAAENQTCAFTGTHTVAYGASSHYAQLSLTNGTLCSNSVFGDPAFGVVKACYYQ